MLVYLLPHYHRQQQCWPSSSTGDSFVGDGSRAQTKLVAVISPEDKPVCLYRLAPSIEISPKRYKITVVANLAESLLHGCGIARDFDRKPLILIATDLPR